MKLLTIILVFTISYTVISCNETKGESKTRTELSGKKPFLNDTIPALFTEANGSVILGWTLRHIKQAIRYDSITGEAMIISDTVFGRLQTFPARDSLNRPLKTKDGKRDSIWADWFVVQKDSVNTEIYGKHFYELTKHK